MKDLIRKLLKEALISSIDKWKENTTDYGSVFGTPICIDDENGNWFYVFVGFTNKGGLSEFSYAFELLNKDGSTITGLLTKRSDVAKILPDELKGKRMIMPIIIELTKMLLTKYKPKIIYRVTVENLTEYSLLRYDEITNILVNEFMYKLTKKSKDENGNDFWFMEMIDDSIDENNDSSEYILVPTKEESVKLWEDKIKSISHLVKEEIKRLNIKYNVKP